MASLNKDQNYDIFNFLQEMNVEKGKLYTHTSMGKPLGSYYIQNENLSTFYELYQKAIMDGQSLHITEKHEDIGPVIIDLDFKYDIEVSTRQHTTEHIQKIVSLYNEIIVDLLEIEATDERLTSFVFERNDVYQTKGITKDGIHILYPKIVSIPEVQYTIREILLKKISPILEKLPLTNKPHDVVDKSVISTTNWLLYGSSKPNIDPYILKYIYNHDGTLLNMEDYTFDGMNIAHFFLSEIRNKVK